MNPSSVVQLISKQKANSRLHIYNYGDDARVVNQGDLLICSSNSLALGSTSNVEFEITIRGRDMFIFQSHVEKAMELWNDNKDYLSQPSAKIIDMATRQRDMVEALRHFKAN
jgi:hypothetical protein